MDKNLERTISTLFPVFERILSGVLLAQLHVTHELPISHFGFGLYIRNHILNAESVLYSQLIASGFTNKDDMSDMIINLFCRYLQKNEEA